MFFLKPRAHHISFFPQIIDGVRDELNRMYEKFCERNPSFLENGGKVSIVAHSLGSVITYDILSLWDIEERHLTEETTAGTGFLTESLTYLRSLSHGETAPDSSNSKGKKRKENVRIELAKARSRVMELEAQLKSEVEHASEAGNGTSEYPLALKFKVCALQSHVLVVTYLPSFPGGLSECMAKRLAKVLIAFSRSHFWEK